MNKIKKNYLFNLELKKINLHLQSKIKRNESDYLQYLLFYVEDFRRGLYCIKIADNTYLKPLPKAEVFLFKKFKYQ